MIKASELRAGVSIVYRIQTDLDSGKQIPVLVTVTANEIKEIESRPEKHNYKPIELTPEWLERFGAVVHHKHDWVYVINDIEITTASNGETFQVHLRLFNRIFTLHYVHQFQNAFALTGQELELKTEAVKQ